VSAQAAGHAPPIGIVSVGVYIPETFITEAGVQPLPTAFIGWERS